MDQTLSRRPHPVSRDTDDGEYATGQYRGMLMRALGLTTPTIGRLPTTLEHTLTSPDGRAAFPSASITDGLLPPSRGWSVLT
ncbi:hypothetical protein [Streptomyces sp. IB2014 016-6]|uniref:hypothetical protein n=1 Tax=Streptomyces sp. IB2014 016-6 TaxID=2517818 RepID=UPI0011CAD31A|nr:hypothetical protein [Streptomyces sp. IB2014 016-6]TXL83892.1 hypothetical protein EW053_36210 [Streptomyces sp. IB2014 016-6]